MGWWSAAGQPVRPVAEAELQKLTDDNNAARASQVQVRTLAGAQFAVLSAASDLPPAQVRFRSSKPNGCLPRLAVRSWPRPTDCQLIQCNALGGLAVRPKRSQSKTSFPSQLSISGMHCSACSSAVEKSIRYCSVGPAFRYMPLLGSKPELSSGHAMTAQFLSFVLVARQANLLQESARYHFRAGGSAEGICSGMPGHQ